MIAVSFLLVGLRSWVGLELKFRFWNWRLVLMQGFCIRICLGVLRTLGFYINFRQLAINGHQCFVLAHAFSPQCAEARLEEEMFINGFALKTGIWPLAAISTACEACSINEDAKTARRARSMN